MKQKINETITFNDLVAMRTYATDQLEAIMKKVPFEASDATKWRDRQDRVAALIENYYSMLERPYDRF